MKSTKILLSFIIIFSFLPFSTHAAELEDYFKYIYNRYSHHFDQNGLKYAVPDYGIKKMSVPTSPREIISLASYYKFRAVNQDPVSQKIIRENLLKSLTALERQKFLSFNDSEALFLAYTLNKQIPNLLNLEETVDLNQTILNSIENGLLAKDTENRAFISSVHFQILINDFFQQGLLQEKRKEYLNQLVEAKIKSAIKQSISSKGWYRENGIVIPHYQGVSAFMLLTYADLTKKEEYKNIAKKIYLNTKKLSFPNGLIEAKIGYRPTGLGAQFYLMMALMGDNLQDKEASVFWNYLKNGNFFQDNRFPDRLEYHCTSCLKKINFHDDYAFSDIAELSYYLTSSSTFLNESTTSKLESKNSNDGEIKIIYQKGKIIVTDLIKKTFVYLTQIKKDTTKIKKLK